MRDSSSFVQRMQWDEVERLIDIRTAAILPIGAAAKQHGMHLPLETDRIQAEHLAARLAESIDALIWPTIAYGHYPAFTEYAGSISLSAPLFEALVEEIASGILGHGCRALLVLDTGISTKPLVARALGRLEAGNTLHLPIYDGPRYRLAAATLSEQNHGSHADELETSLMLAVAPHLVDMSRAEASPPLKAIVPGRLTPLDASSPNYSRSGSFGDPAKASVSKGEVLLAAMLDDIHKQASSFLGRLAFSTDPI